MQDQTASQIINWWLNSMNGNSTSNKVNRMKIDNFRNSAHVDLLADVDLKNNWWLTWLKKSYANPVQISSSIGWKLRVLEIWQSCWPLAYVDLLTSNTKASYLCQTLACDEVSWRLVENCDLKLIDMQPDRQTHAQDQPIYLKNLRFSQVTNKQMNQCHP